MKSFSQTVVFSHPEVGGTAIVYTELGSAKVKPHVIAITTTVKDICTSNGMIDSCAIPGYEYALGVDSFGLQMVSSLVGMDYLPLSFYFQLIGNGPCKSWERDSVNGDFKTSTGATGEHSHKPLSCTLFIKLTSLNRPQLWLPRMVKPLQDTNYFNSG